MVNGETSVAKRCVSCKRRGVMPSLGSPLPSLTSPFPLPQMAPNHAQPWLLRNRKKKRRSKRRRRARARPVGGGSTQRVG